MDVNYIREINAFYNELEIKPLSSSAIALWHALLHLNNRCGWKDSFSVPVGTLSLKSGLSDRSVLNARNELKTKGYLVFQSREGNRSAVYQLTRLSAKFADNVSDNLSHNLSDNVSDNPSDNLSILDKHKQNKTKTKNNKPPVSHKKQFAEFVTMTDAEYQKLVELYGEAFAQRCIEVLNNYKGASGKKYKSDYMAILNWVVERVAKEGERFAKSRASPERSDNEYDRLSL